MLSLLNDFDKAERFCQCSVYIQRYAFTYGLMSVMYFSHALS